MTLNQYPHKKPGESWTAGSPEDDWNALVDVNWDIAGAWHLAGADLSGLAAGTQLGAWGWLAGVKRSVNFGALNLTIPNRAHCQHLEIVASGLRTSKASVFENTKIVLNDDTTAGNYYYSYVYCDGVSETQAQSLGTAGYVTVIMSGDSNDAGCYGAFWLRVYNYRSAGPKLLRFGSICPGRTAGAGKREELSGGGAYWGTAAISSVSIESVDNNNFLCEGTNHPDFILNVYGIHGSDNL